MSFVDGSGNTLRFPHAVLVESSIQPTTSDRRCRTYLSETHTYQLVTLPMELVLRMQSSLLQHWKLPFQSEAQIMMHVVICNAVYS